LVSDQGQWYKAGRGLVPVRWVVVRDPPGTPRDAYFCTTEPALAPEPLVSRYTERGRRETTYQELRAHLGLETTRPRVAASVLGTGPCLLGRFRVRSLIDAAHLGDHRPERQSLSWYAKEEPTFADALTAVRRLFGEETSFASSAERAGLAKLPADLKETLLNCLCPAA
jgi:hypothetical protein